MPPGRPLIYTLLMQLLLCTCITGIAQDSAAKKTSYLKSYWTNGIGILREPFTWKGDDWVKPASGMLITGLTITVDEPLSNLFDKPSENFVSRFADAGDKLGGVPVQFAISAAPIVAGALAKKQSWVDFGTDNLQAQIFAGGFVYLTKELTHRARPNTGEPAYSWYGPFDGKGNKSFYSGHTTLAFATATMVFLHADKKWWVGLIAYTFASGVGVSRIMGREHWPSDVVAGAIMGSAVSSFVYYEQEKRRKRNTRLLKPLP